MVCQMKFLEDMLQQQVFEYLNLVNVFAFHPKASGRKSIQSALRDKRLGVKAGIPDVVIIGFDGIARYIELKTAAGKLSESQKAFRAFCSLHDIPWALCRSVDEVKGALGSWGLL